MRFLNHTLPANVFDLGDFKVHRKVWLTYSAGLAAMANVAKIFLFPNDLTQIINFLLGSLAVVVPVKFFWIYLFLLTLKFVLQ